MRTVAAQVGVPLTPEGARRLWTDLRRWPSFVDGFGRVLEASDDWPHRGAKLVWQSGAAGRGRVTERVLENAGDRFVTEVFEQALHGRQTVLFGEQEGGARVELRLEYELARGGPLRTLTDVLFVRRAQRDAMRRTLRRFAVEAEEEAGLR